MNRILLEVAVTTCDEAIRAAAAGADRLELCSVLEVGGVTPSPGTFLAVREAVSVPVYVLVRPRPGGFDYLEDDFAAMKRDAEWFLRNGADGIVSGAIIERNGRKRIDQVRSAELVAIAAGKAVFHRAFDFLPNLLAQLDELVTLGFERVLTSGGAACAEDGQAMIVELVRQAEGRIEVLPGGGIRPGNVTNLLEATGCDQIHASCRWPLAPMANNDLARQMGLHSTTDAGVVRELRAALDAFAAGR